MSQTNDDNFSYNLDDITEDNAPVILDIDGHINLKVPDEDEVPASGIILNKEHMSERNKILPHSIPDKRFPEITHFQYINDDNKYPNREFDELINWMDGFEYLPEEFEIYDEILNLEGTYLVMHIRVEYGEVTELYITIESENEKALENENALEDEEAFEEDEEYEFDIRTKITEVSDATRSVYKAYIESQDVTNCSMIPTSFLSAYLSAYPVSDWKETILNTVEDGSEDYIFPIHVEHNK
jgi:hypothetical protein